MPHSTSSYKSTAEALLTNRGMPARYQYGGEPISATLARMPGLKFDDFGAISYQTPGRPGVITVEPASDHPSRWDEAAAVPTYLDLKVDELDMLDYNSSCGSYSTRGSLPSAKSIRYAPGTILNPHRNLDFQRRNSPYPESMAYEERGRAYSTAAASSVYSRGTNSVTSAPRSTSSKTSHSVHPAPRIPSIVPSLASNKSKHSVREPDHTHLEVPSFRPSSPSLASHMEVERRRESALIRLCGGFKPTAPIPRSEAPSGSSRGSYMHPARSVSTESIPRSRVPGVPSAIAEEPSDEEDGIMYNARAMRTVVKTNRSGGPRPTLVAVRSRRTGKVRYERRYGYSSCSSTDGA